MESDKDNTTKVIGSYEEESKEEDCIKLSLPTSPENRFNQQQSLVLVDE